MYFFSSLVNIMVDEIAYLRHDSQATVGWLMVVCCFGSFVKSSSVLPFGVSISIMLDKSFAPAISESRAEADMTDNVIYRQPRC